MLENQIYSIESANINQESLNAMKNAGKAMRDIHGNLNIDKVDAIMFVLPSHIDQSLILSTFYPERAVILAFSKNSSWLTFLYKRREELTEQKALADEIGNAIASGPQTGDPIDEGELEDELANMEQENLDEKMLKTGTVPVLPNGPVGEGEFHPQTIYTTPRPSFYPPPSYLPPSCPLQQCKI